VRTPRSLLALVVSVAVFAALAVNGAGPASSVPTAGRGIASRDPDMSVSDADKLRDVGGAGWTYAWRYRKIPDRQPGLDIVPMIRTQSSILSDTVSYLQAKKASGAFKYLLGFNEPDNASQANMTPTKAADLWPTLQQTGLVLGSPAVAHPTNGWLKSFMSLATSRHLKVDFIALHFYASITDTGAAARIKSQIQAVRAAYGKPIWVTELGIIDTRTGDVGSDSTNWVKAANQLRALTSMLDSLSYVQRYAWVADQIADTQPHLRWSALFTSAGTLTAVGRTYAALSQ
jgi:hypothetical protein